MKPHNRVSADPRAMLRQARHKMDMGLAREALSLTSQILDQDADHLGALELHVCAQWRAGDFIGALRSLRRLTLINPYEPGYFLMQGDTLNLIGRPLEARKAYERCLSFTGTPAREDALSHIAQIDALLGKGVANDALGMWDTADSVIYAGDSASHVGLTTRPS